MTSCPQYPSSVEARWCRYYGSHISCTCLFWPMNALLMTFPTSSRTLETKLVTQSYPSLCVRMLRVCNKWSHGPKWKVDESPSLLLLCISKECPTQRLSNKPKTGLNGRSWASEDDFLVNVLIVIISFWPYGISFGNSSQTHRLHNCNNALE